MRRLLAGAAAAISLAGAVTAWRNRGYLRRRAAQASIGPTSEPVSVLIPARNEERRLPDCLEHLARQRPDCEFEILVYDDGSSDRTQQLVHEWQAANPQVPLRVLTLLIRHRVYGSKLGADAEAGVLRQIEEDSRTAHERALAEISIAVPTDSVTPTGDSVRSALQRLDWEGDEILLLGSSGGGPLRRVFLGDMTYKLVRATGVPAVVLPRRT